MLKARGDEELRTMIDLVKKFLRKSVGNGVAEHLEKRCQNTQVATCAILLEMAGIDNEFSKEEQESLISILKKRYGLSNEDAEELLLASNKELEGSIDLWRFTNLINRDYAIEEKREIIRIVWEIAYADGKLEKHEDYLLHKLAELLHLTHKQLIDAKLSVLEDRKKGSPETA
ncbi:MAG: TerB family tellurite resistance protein [Deltaproteobacteria bacterium]|nr:TerB family tellurite resistance protein [Deltaproteobacteria bacterium]